MVLQVRGSTDLCGSHIQQASARHIGDCRRGGPASGCPAVSPQRLGKWDRRQRPSAPLTAPLPFFSVLMAVNYFQRLELESENPRYSLECLPSVVIHCLVCRFLLVCRSQVYLRTVHSVESSTVERKELQGLPPALPSLDQQSHTEKQFPGHIAAALNSL